MKYPIAACCPSAGAVSELTFTRELSWPETLLDRHFSHCAFVCVDFSHFDLEGSVFEFCDFMECCLRSSNLSDCRFRNCNFYPTDYPKASSSPSRSENMGKSSPAETQGCDFGYADMIETSFDRCDLSLASFNRVNARGLILSHCQAQGVDFDCADFALHVATTRALNQASLTHCNLAYANFSGVDLSGCNLSENRLVHALFNRTNLTDADLSDSDLSNVEGDGMVLKGANLKGARFNNLDPRRIDLEGVRISPEQMPWLLQPLGIDIDTQG